MEGARGAVRHEGRFRLTLIAFAIALMASAATAFAAAGELDPTFGASGKVRV